jgi:hypothetical protein
MIRTESELIRTIEQIDNEIEAHMNSLKIVEMHERAIRELKGVRVERVNELRGIGFQTSD